MGTIADELNERSKFDDKMIVGAEIRAAIAELEAERDRLRAGLKETTMLFKFLLEPESVLNLHHCDEMEKLIALNKEP